VTKPGRVSCKVTAKCLKAGLLLPIGAGILSSLQRPDWLCGPPSLLSNDYRAFNVKVTSHFHQAPRLRMCGDSLPLPLHAALAWYACVDSGCLHDPCSANRITAAIIVLEHVHPPVHGCFPWVKTVVLHKMMNVYLHGTIRLHEAVVREHEGNSTFHGR
jgi:hypothetical protein